MASRATPLVLVLGAFDILHWGHLDFLSKASKFGKVAVGLSGDTFLTLSKRSPIFGFDERKEALETLGFDVLERGKASARDLFIITQPDFFVCGNDWLHGNHLASADLDSEFLNQLDCSVVYTPRPHSMSTSEVIGRIRG